MTNQMIAERGASKLSKSELVRRVAAHRLFVGAAHDLSQWSKNDLIHTYVELFAGR